MRAALWRGLFTLGTATAIRHSPVVPALRTTTHGLSLVVRLRGGDAGPRTAANTSTTTDASKPVPSASTSAPRLARGRGARGSARGRGRVAGARGRAHAPTPAAAMGETIADTEPVTKPVASDPSALEASFSKLVLWEQPLASATAFALGNLLFALAASGRISAAALTGTILFYALICSAVLHLVARIARAVIGKGPLLTALTDVITSAVPPALLPKAQLISVATASSVGASLAKFVNEGADFLKLAASAADPLLSISAIGAAFLLKSVGGLLGLLGLAWICFAISFLLPKVAEVFGAQTGAAIASGLQTLLEAAESAKQSALTQASSLSALLVESLPPSLKGFIPPVGSRDP